MDEVLEAVKEASISIACCLDEVDDVTQQDLEHIQSQITIIENYLEEKKNGKN
jgi:AMMECR1 domain-containing protein